MSNTEVKDISKQRILQAIEDIKATCQIFDSEVVCSGFCINSARAEGIRKRLEHLHTLLRDIHHEFPDTLK